MAAVAVATVALVTAPAARWNAEAQELSEADAKLAEKCQKSLAKAAATFTGKRLGLAGTCTETIFACLQTKPDGAKRDACVAKAATKCRGAFAKIDAATGKLHTAIMKQCASLGVAGLTAPDGLGFAGHPPACEEALGRPVGSVADLATCLTATHACAIDAMLGVAAPRAKALLRHAGALDGLADPFLCLPDRGGTDEAVADRRGTGKALTKCARAIRTKASALGAKRLKALGRCATALFACEQRDDQACRTKAATSCEKAFAAVAAAADDLPSDLAAKCASPLQAEALQLAGLHLGAVTDVCAAVGVPVVASFGQHATCLIRQQACAVEELAQAAVPRAAGLLAAQGLSLYSPFCPGAPPLPTPTPVTTPVRTATPTASPTPGPGSCGNGLIDGAKEVCDGAALAGATCATLRFAGGTVACAASCRGFDSTGCTLPGEPPPDPATVAPPPDLSVVSGFGATVDFLFRGDPPIQYGVVAGTIDPVTAAVVRGKVLDAGGAALVGVEIRILERPEFGATQSRADGAFDLVVNGGGKLIVRYEKSGFLPAQRQIDVPWQDYVATPEVRLCPLDAQATAVDLATATGITVARGSQKTDADGTRRATLLIEPGTAAEMLLPDGSTEPLTQMTVRATEYTVGASGPARMPAVLPPTSGYTYAVEFSLDEAMAAGAPMVQFDRPIPTYVENFPGFPAGTAVPAGYYDHLRGAWVAAPNGRVIDVVGITSDRVDLDVTGDGVADTGTALADLGIDDGERATLATLYGPGTSLWRVPVDHFSTWDYNWPYGPPGDAESPADSGAGAQSDDEPIDGSCEARGSVIECENQVLGEDLVVAGTPYTLHYRSDRVPGRLDSLDLRLSGAAVPASLQSIRVRATVAGNTTEQSFAPGPNQSLVMTWNGRDAYGRPVQGGQRVTGSIDYVYPAVYRSPAQLNEAFANFGGTALTANRAAATIAASMPFEVVLREGITDARGLGLGGWTLGVHHFYDPTTRVLHLGSGERRRAESVARVIDRVLESTGPFGGSGTLTSVAIASDGSIYFARLDKRIRRLAPDGTETIVAGTGKSNVGPPDAPFGDGGPATQAKLITSPTTLRFGADGSLYFVDLSVLRRIRPDGIIERAAGIYNFGVSPCHEASVTPDGAVALESTICIDDFTVAPDGTLYLAVFYPFPDDSRIRRVGRDGTLVTVAGSGPCPPFHSGTCGDGGPAVAAKLLAGNRKIALAPDGTLYLTDGNRIRKVTSDGIITSVAGVDFQNGFAGDGFPASSATRFCGPTGFAFTPDGAVIIVDGNNNRVRRIAADGLVSTIVGSGTACGVANIGQAGDGGPALQAIIAWPQQLALAPDGDVFVVAGLPRRIRRIGKPLPGFSAADILVASEDGRLLYAFDPNGKHLATFDALTGALRRAFAYDAAGRLAQVIEKTGATDNVTTIQRDGAGHPTAIVGPFGKATALGVDGNGFLASITNPAGETTALGSTASGLLTTLTAPGGRTGSFTYDAAGRLLTDEDPGPGSQTLDRSGPPEAFTVIRTTALGRATTYEVERLPDRVERRTITAPDGTAAIVTDNRDAATRTTSAPSGTVHTITAGGDPRFGIQAPVATSVSLQFPGGLTALTTNARTATVANVLDPLSLVTLTETSTVASHTWTTTYTAATRTLLTTSPLGRTRTLTLDALGRPATLQASGGAATAATYDGRGRLATVTTGTPPAERVVTFGYDAQGIVATVTDPIGRTVTMERDGAGRLIRKILPSGDEIHVDFAANGDFAGITPPGRPAHAFAYDARGMLASITPPAVAGTGATTFAYDDDGALTTVTRPGESVVFAYDAAGRLATLDLDVDDGPQGAYTVGYDATTGQVATATGPGGATLAYGYDGALVAGVTWSGPVTGSLTLEHDARLAITTESVNGGASITFTHDDDDHLIAAGALAISRDAATGLPATTTLGVVSDTWTYDGFGDLTDYAATANGAPLYAESCDHDGLGRITRRVETIAGGTDTYDYAYDAKGQLTEVRRDDAVVESYTYDPNGNRTAATVGGSSVTATYDDQDRVLTYGTATFTHTPSGRRAERTTPGGTTAYTYDAVGNLLAVNLPSATDVTYALDPGMRRVARDVDGVAAERFLYSGNRPIAELDAGGALVTRFVYAGGPAPAYFVRGGTAHRLLTDHAGSVRLVVNAATGAVVQRLDYDGFGRVTLDTNPGFQPFGFAGGLYDPATGLVHFDARDYDAATGRWTAKDPIGFAGLDTNLYRYAGNDPVNLHDPSGLTVGEIITGVMAGLVDIAMFPVSFSHGMAVLNANLTGQPVPPDPNPIVGFLNALNEIAANFFDAEPLVETDGTAFTATRICSSIVGTLGAGAAAGAGRAAGASGGIRPAMQAAGRGIAQTADDAYRPLVSGQAARAERLAAENAKRIAEQEAKQAAQQASERELWLIRPEGGGAGTHGVGKPAGGFGIGR